MKIVGIEALSSWSVKVLAENIVGMKKPASNPRKTNMRSNDMYQDIVNHLIDNMSMPPLKGGGHKRVVGLDTGWNNK